MTKPLVFISHIGDEREVALAFKRLVTDAFIGMIDVFVSSDPNSLSMGDKWLDQITDGLRHCAIEVVLASPASIKRPWINFEAGAGWVRDVPVIPICHSGITPKTLPPPLSSLQAALATDHVQLTNVFAVLAKALECTCPKVNFDDFIATVQSYEQTSQQLTTANGLMLTAEVDGLSEHAKAAIVAVAECTEGPGAWAFVHMVRERMNEAGYKDIATSLGIAALFRLGLVSVSEKDGEFYNRSSTAVELTSSGWRWLEEHCDLIEMRFPPAASTANDEIPF